MTTLTDAKLATLETLTGNTGHVQDLELQYLLLLVTGPVVANTIDDLWFQVFDEASIPAGQFNDRFYAYMDTILAPATQDHYNDRRQEYWEGGATPLGPPLPPALANLAHWWDATDLAPQQTFADAAGTILATPGGLMERINDKGLNALFVSEVGAAVPFWSTVANGVNGLQVISTPTSGFFPAAVASAGWGAGMSFAIIEKQNSGTGTQVPFGYDGAKLNHQAVLPATGWRTKIPGLGFINTNKQVVLGEWVWHYFTVDAAGNFRIATSGAVEVTGSGVYAPMPGGGVISFTNWPGDVAEIMLWNRALTVPETDQFIAYVDGRYGIMPFVPLPPIVAPLLHHFDFTDATTVFKNPPATQPALDGDFIRQINNKGSDGTPIISASTAVAPILRTNIVNGLQIADYNGLAKELLAVIAAGHASSSLGLSMALVFRWITGLSISNEMATWGGNFARTAATREGVFFVAGLPGNVISLAPLVASDWYLGAFAFDGGGGTDRFQWSGEALQSFALGALTDIAGGSSLEIKNATTEIQVAEFAVWAGQLTAAEFTALFGYADAKYGTLPHA